MKRVLIIGHGQLGLMIAAESARLGVQVDRLDLVSNELIGGTSQLRKPMDVAAIIDEYDVITCELEHLPDNPTIKALTSSTKWINGRALKVLANRRTQKELIDTLGLATAPWMPLGNTDDTQLALSEIGERLVVKTERGGYDGKGQWRIDAKNSDLPKEVFGNCIAEAMIGFEREVSIIGARNANGDTRFFPLAENVHRDGILRVSRAAHINDKALQDQAESILSALLHELDYIGVMAVELFDVGGELLINEIAPRVHNSGHWSQFGALDNQFFYHLNALLGFDFRDQTYRDTTMLNLIGIPWNPAWLTVPNISVHWYGKDYRPGRKLGHINFASHDTEAIAALAPLLDDVHREILTTQHFT